MSEINGATTLLEAVNVILSYVGEQPVNSLDDSEVSPAAQAERMLKEISREVQSKGLHCNTEYRYPLKRDEATGMIPIPVNVLSIDPTRDDQNYTQRGGNLYDLGNHTYQFTKEIVNVDIVWFLDFTDLPEKIRRYICIRAGRHLAKRFLGSAELASITEADEYNAWGDVIQEELDCGDYNFLDTPDVQPIIQRKNNPKYLRW